MEFQSIQQPGIASFLYENGIGINRQAGREQGQQGSSLESLTQSRFTEFKLEIRISSKENFTDQGKSYEKLSLLELNISYLEIESGTDSAPLKPKAPASLDIFNNSYWGVEQTAERLASFVINGAGDDLEKMRQGRDGIIRGFKEAEKMWGGQLPDISYETLNRALEAIDQQLRQAGAPVVDIAA